MRRNPRPRDGVFLVNYNLSLIRPAPDPRSRQWRHADETGRPHMAITVEYLAIFRRTDSFCNSVASFTRLLQVDSEIRVTGGEIHFQGERACAFQISSGEVTGK